MTFKKEWENTENHRYEDMLEAFDAGFKKMLEKTLNGKMFTTDATGLWELYLNNLPDQLRQVYNCRTCKQFIERFGNLVFIDATGKTFSAFWDFEAPEYFKATMKALKKAVEKARVTGVFVASKRELGTFITGEWHHLAVQLPSAYVNTSRLLTAEQVMAEKREEFGMLSRGLVEYNLNTVTTAISLLDSETLYRSDRVLGVANWLKKLHDNREEVNTCEKKRNITWLAVANAPNGFCHVKSSMIGTLLDDIASGLPYASVKARFDEKMNPNQYMRSQTAPSANQIREAEKAVEKLGIIPSLERRHARLDEIPTFLWKPNTNNIEEKTVSKGGIFSNLVPKENKDAGIDMSIPVKLMTWEKFLNTVLPTADSVEVKVEDSRRLMGLVTATNEDAPNIFQWNNTFSWYYQGGVDAEIRRRLEEAGGKFEDNAIRCSLIWGSYTDLDLHCLHPNGREIYYGNRVSGCGNLDVDMNAGSGKSMKPVENIRFSHEARNGKYRFTVENFSDRNRGSNPFKVELEVNGQVWTFEGRADRTGVEVTAFEFDYNDGVVTFAGKQPEGGKSSNEAMSEWNLQANSFVKVAGITTSPNLWDATPKHHLGTHVFFMLDGCKDNSGSKGRGFFSEMLQGEIKQYRRVLEAFTAQTPLSGKEEGNAFGLGFIKGVDWNVTVKVASNGQTKYFKIDRWD